MITYDSAIKSDIPHIAALHVQHINAGFLSNLGPRFLEILYGSILESKGSFIIVARDEGRVAGFICGSNNLGGLYKETLRKSFIKLSLALLPRIINPKIAYGVLETLIHPAKERADVPGAELVSIVISDDYIGAGVAQGLFDRMVERFSQMDVHAFKVTVGSGLARANAFYKKMGFRLSHTTSLHRGVESNVYVWERDTSANGGGA